MGGEQKHQSPHQEERDQAVAQVGAIDMVNRVANIVPFVGNIRVFGKTDFEGHALNAMIDMVDAANPEHLETAANALLNARDSIQKAAEELRGHIPRVDWEGESGTAFRDWGNNLVLHALNLATFAEVAGTQITAAATGLASVRKAMPPRDTRPDPTQTPASIPTPEQVSTNKEYAAAVKAEQDRQEAINQMNRLASFYAVSEETLAAQEPPTFEAMPDVGVPKPTAHGYDPGKSQESEGLATRQSVAIDHESSRVSSGHTRAGDTTAPLKDVDDLHIAPTENVGTKIDTVGTLPPQETARPVAPQQPPVSGTGGANGGMVPPFASGTVPPAFGGPAGRVSGTGGASGTKSPISGNRSPISSQGRAGTSGGSATGRSATGPMGRAATTGQSGIRGSNGAAGRSPIGRGVTGGTPRPIGGPASGRTGGVGSTGAARGNGVVGGKPTTSAPSGATGSRMPRGTVVGAEGGSSTKTPAGTIGQRGVIGAPNPGAGTRAGQTSRGVIGAPHPGAGADAGQTARPLPSNPDGVAGKPTGRASAGRSGGITGDNARPPRNPAGSQRSTNRVDDKGERRSGTQRRNTPPATD